ncbi:hypothetical protein NS277_12745 [Novosphingobium barchaimii]|nr:hypothetical protein NS277_12745 [Novosphingobium barchaimii]
MVKLLYLCAQYLKKSQTFISQTDFSRETIEKTEAKTSFELCDTLTDRSRCDAQLRRSFAKA